TTAKGKIEADVFVSPMPEAETLMIDGPLELREELFARLDRYIIADDAELEDVTGDWCMTHYFGGAPEQFETGGWIRSANRYGISGTDLITPTPTPNAGSGLTEDQLEEVRIVNGIARWGAELGPSVLPQEALLQDRAIDFHKGCYIGQEIISRIKSVGKVNRYLVSMVADADSRIEKGWSLENEDRTVGTISSCVHSPNLDRMIALGFVKRGHETPGTRLKAKSDENNLSSWLEIRETSLI
ncbi:MAG: glycine cleavage T C-terminal barrel domain-containing protein, partial [Verrucomicrobiota bacterium]